MKYEDRLEKLKLENEALSDKVGKNASDMCHMDEQIQQLELELTISREKHRTCQQEVGVVAIVSVAHSIYSNVLGGYFSWFNSELNFG